jgi:hypothetical protein
MIQNNKDTQVPDVRLRGSPAATEYNGKLYCFYQGDNDNKQLWYCNFDGKNWSKDAQISDVRLRGSPAATEYNGKLYCFYQGDNDNKQLWYCSFYETNRT